MCFNLFNRYYSNSCRSGSSYPYPTRRPAVLLHEGKEEVFTTPTGACQHCPGHLWGQRASGLQQHNQAHLIPQSSPLTPVQVNDADCWNSFCTTEQTQIEEKGNCNVMSTDLTFSLFLMQCSVKMSCWKSVCSQVKREGVFFFLVWRWITTRYLPMRPVKLCKYFLLHCSSFYYVIRHL